MWSRFGPTLDFVLGFPPVCDRFVTWFWQGAHHLDLRSSNPADPESVIVVRNIHRMHIKQWIKGHAAGIDGVTSF